MHSEFGTLAGGLPHSDIPGSRLGYQLPWAFRRFPRPSSPLDAKTSTVCPYGLIAPTRRRDSLGPSPSFVPPTAWPFQPQAFSFTQLRSTSRFNFAQLAPNAPRTRSIEPRPNVRSRHSSLIRLPKSGLRRGSIRCGAEQSEPLFRASGSPKREGTIAHHAFESSRLPLAFHPPPPPPPSSSSRSRRLGCSPGLNAGGPASGPLPNRPRT